MFEKLFNFALLRPFSKVLHLLNLHELLDAHLHFPLEEIGLPRLHFLGSFDFLDAFDKDVSVEQGMWLDLGHWALIRIKQVFMHNVLVQALLEVFVVCNVPPSYYPGMLLTDLGLSTHNLFLGRPLFRLILL